MKNFTLDCTVVLLLTKLFLFIVNLFFIKKQIIQQVTQDTQFKKH